MNVLAIAAHPDDETLGCGATLLRHRAAGDNVHWLIATETWQPQWDAAVTEAKRREVEAVAQAYAVASLHLMRLPSTKLDTLPLGQLVDGINRVAEQTRPAVVYIVHHGDVHSDHGVVASAGHAVFKAFRMKQLGVSRVLAYETLSSTEAAPSHAHRAFQPTVFSDISAFLERKLETMALYASECQRDPLPRGPSAIRALARYRGASVGVEAAEAFVLIRELS